MCYELGWYDEKRWISAIFLMQNIDERFFFFFWLIVLARIKCGGHYAGTVGIVYLKLRWPHLWTTCIRCHFYGSLVVQRGLQMHTRHNELRPGNYLLIYTLYAHTTHTNKLIYKHDKSKNSIKIFFHILIIYAWRGFLKI